MYRKPRSSGGSLDSVPILVFSKEGSTVYTRLIHRKPYRLTLRHGGSVDAVQYDTKWWPFYKSETFPENSQQWLNEGDTIYDPNLEPLKLPLKHDYLFECDVPRGNYAW
jgi:hypothetical protein